MTLEEVEQLPNAQRFGWTTDISLWMDDNHGQGPRILYLSGRVAIVPNPGGSQVIMIRELKDKRRKYIRINRRAGRDWKTAALLRLGFTEVEIGTSKLLTRLGVDPA